MKKKERILSLFLIAVVLFSLLSVPSVIDAHAYLEQSFPAQESRLTEAPSEIRVKFTEGINPNVSRLILQNEAGEEIEAQQQANGDDGLILELPPLEHGIYKVVWQVLSVDTHVTDGSFRFSIGVELPQLRPEATISLDQQPSSEQKETGLPNEKADGRAGDEGGDATGEESQQGLNLGDSIQRAFDLIQLNFVSIPLLRVLELVSAMILTGWLFFQFWILGEARGLEDRRIIFPQLKVIRLSVFLLFIVTGIGHLLLRAAPFVDTWGDERFWTVVGDLATTSAIGIMTWVRPLILLALLLIPFRVTNRISLSLLALLFLGTFTLTGHSASGLSLTHFIHVVLGAIWLGGLLGLTVLSFEVKREVRALRRVHEKIKLFSQIAFGTVIMITLSGGFLSLFFLGRLNDLWTTDYGGYILVKVGLLIGALFIAAWHRYVWLPELQEAEQALVKTEAEKTMNSLLWGIRIELLIVLTIIIVAGVLSSTSPPVDPSSIGHKH